jgi:HEAT repeat protein
MEKILSKVFWGGLTIVSVLVSGCFQGTMEENIKNLESSNIAVRKDAVQRRGTAKEKKAVPGLAALLKKEDSDPVKLSIIDALIKINKGGLLDRISSMWKQTENKSHIKMSIDALMKQFNAENNEIRIAAVDAVGRIGDKDAVPGLTGLLKTCDKTLKLTVFRALGNIGDDSGVLVLTSFLNDRDEYIKYNAAQALKKIGKNK